MHSDDLERRIRARLDQLTKPPGSLGVLEELAVGYALARGQLLPAIRSKALYVFCGDHGVTQERISPYPASVTVEMMRNFVRGGAAINVLCRMHGIRPLIVDVGAAGPPLEGVIHRKIAPGTRNFAREAAMSRDQALRAVETGVQLAVEAARRCDLAGLGEMGIGNTSCAAAVVSALTGRDPCDTVGAGTGASPSMVEHKIDVIRRALGLHRPDPRDAIGVLSAVGGFEIAAIAGFLLRASELRLPVVLDGFPCCAGALAARALDAAALRTCFFAHRSAERGHAVLLEELGARPLLDLGMRLGEGTGAALGMALIESAVRLYREMATFEEAGVSNAPG